MDMGGSRSAGKSGRGSRKAAEPQGEYHARSASEISKEIKRMEEQMFQHARDLEFEQAAALRDQIQRLRNEGVPVKYIYLDADEATLRRRMIDTGRELPDSWCVRHIPDCLAAQARDTHAVHIGTVGRTPDEIAHEIAALPISDAQEAAGEQG